MSSQILVLNAGSSSIKFAVFNTGQPLQRTVLGMVSGIGSTAAFSARNDRGPLPGTLPPGTINHEGALGWLFSWLEDGGHARQLLGFEVRRDFQEDRRMAGQAGPRRREAFEQFVQRRPGLQGAQARRVGRADIDGEIVGQAPEAGQARAVVGDAVRRLLVGPQIGADDAAGALGAAFFKAAREGFQPAGIEPHAVDHRLVVGETE